MDKATVAVFDFDGTLTTRDTLPLFVDFVKGRGAFALAMLRRLPALWQYGIDRLGGKTADLSSVKEALLSPCFSGIACDDMQVTAQDFAAVVDGCLNRRVMQALRTHQEAGHQVAIASASPSVWIEPWASRHGISVVIATRMAVTDTGGKHRFTGLFEGANCNGEEKRRRVEAVYPRERFRLVAYGNSRGDYPLLRYAQEAYLCSPRAITPFVAAPD